MPVVKKNVNLNLQQLIRWKENPTVNPKTGKTIKINGPVYNEIQKRYDKYMEPYSKAECDRWFTDKNINPKTGKNIKTGLVVYERVRTACEPYLEQTDEKRLQINENEYNENIEEQYEEDLKRIPFYKKLYSKCTSCAIRLKDNIITNLGCSNTMCMVKGCPWNGSFGINLTRIPISIKIFVLKVILKFIHPDRCCCMCLGHLLMIFSFICFKIQESRIDRLTRDSIKIQTIINKIESSINLDKDVSIMISSTANEQITGYLKNKLFNIKQGYYDIIKYIYNYANINKEKFSEGIQLLNDQLEIP
jgi:hypothetical protein